jgi:hypothetical protein
MKYQEINEGPRTTLPLNKGVMRNARGRRDALLAVMDPMDFLRLTTKNQAEIDSVINTVDRSIEQYASGQGVYNKTEYFLPYLGVSFPSGHVFSHEGRHRAAMIIKAGGKSFPVTVYFNSETTYVVTWKRLDDNGDPVIGAEGDDVIFSRKFLSRASASEFLEQTRADGDCFNVRKETLHGGMLKGHPDRNNFDVHPYEYGKWAVEDMPKVLTGQFDPSVKVSTSDMKIGLIKKGG